jgi:hypothetical protein
LKEESLPWPERRRYCNLSGTRRGRGELSGSEE